MITKGIKILIVVNFFYMCSFGQNLDIVKILPGKGLVFNNDSILLYKTTIDELCRILKIKDSKKSGENTVTYWDGFSEKTGNDTSGTYFSKKIKFKSLLFEFKNDTDKLNLKLQWIETREDKSLKVYTDSGIEIGMLNPKIKEIYSKFEKCDFVSENELTYNLYTYGISFLLEKLSNNDLKLVEISTHYTLK